MAILTACAGHATVGVTEIAASVHLSAATAHRYIRTLQVLGYLERDPTTRRYRLGPRMAGLQVSYAVDAISIREAALPTMRRLFEMSGQTVSIAILDGVEAVFLERLWPPGLEANPGVGSRLPAYCTSHGKILLAHLSRESLLKRIKQIDFVKRGKNTLTKRGLLLDLERIRQIGYALNNEELGDGLRSIAAPIRAESGEVVASINVAVNASQLTVEQLTQRYASPVMGAAAEISHALVLSQVRTRGHRSAERSRLAG
jgi:IclR family pca regulon transcriptional regulator